MTRKKLAKKRDIPRTFRKIIDLWLPVIGWLIVIFIFSAYPTKRTSEIFWQDFLLKKTAHIIEYGVLAVLIYRGLVNSGVKARKAKGYAIVFAAMYGISDEFHQSFVPGRESRTRDVFIDTLGAILAMYSLSYYSVAPERLKNFVRKLKIVNKI